MQAVTGFARKYAIMEELDSGFGTGNSPEAFIRLDAWEGRIQASVHIKNLKPGPYFYKLYLIFAKGDQLAAIPVGQINTDFQGMQSGLEISVDSLKDAGVKPEAVRYAAITAEGNDRKWIPLFSCFEKTFKWDESIRQLLMKKTVAAEEPADALRQPEPNISLNDQIRMNYREREEREAEPVPQVSSITPPPMPVRQPPAPSKQDAITSKCDLGKLETLLHNNFELCAPFVNGHKGYTWYRVTDLAKLSNIMFMAGINVPVFANPKILVGLFRYKHILAGLYKGEPSNFFVIGVPAKNDKDNRPFENACRWAGTPDNPVRELGGYWLVYVSLKTGEIVM